MAKTKPPGVVPDGFDEDEDLRQLAIPKNFFKYPLARREANMVSFVPC